MQLDLLTYPVRAGFKAHGTSQEAAEGIERTGRAARLRSLVLDWFKAGNTGTADECAHALGEDILSVRPRVTELNKRDLLVATGERRRADGGRNANVWRMA